MWEITSPLADRLFAISNLVLIVGAAAVLVGTIGSIVMSGVREQFSNERISANESATAEANARAAEAQLALERLRAPRGFIGNQGARLIDHLKQFKGQKFSALLPTAGLDTESFWIILNNALSDAGWIRVDPPGLIVGDPPHGVAVSASPGIYVGVAPSARETVGPAAIALAHALVEARIVAQAGLDSEAEKTQQPLRSR
jgi:hypothetical protein